MLQASLVLSLQICTYLVWGIIAMPGNNIERRVILWSNEEKSLIFTDDCKVLDTVFKPSNWSQKISIIRKLLITRLHLVGCHQDIFLPWICQAICTNGAQIRQNKMVIVNLQDISKMRTLAFMRTDWLNVSHPLEGPSTPTLNLMPCWMTQISLGLTFILQHQNSQQLSVNSCQSIIYRVNNQ